MRKWVGKTAPDFELRLLDGTKFRLADTVGEKVVILNFFATWCGPCRREIPEFIRFANEHKDPGFLLLFIDAEEEDGVVRKFAAAELPGLPVGIDTNGGILKSYDVKAYPTSVLIDPRGMVLVYQVGALSNADVVFSPHVRSGLQLVRRGPGTLRENYLAKMDIAAAKKSPTGGLTGKSLDIARKINCPSCGKDLSNCRDQTGAKIRTRLRKLDLETMSDEAILRSLFMAEAKP
jgi:thiol-disulfide isomerase/thioredoxin